VKTPEIAATPGLDGLFVGPAETGLMLSLNYISAQMPMRSLITIFISRQFSSGSACC